MYIEHVSHIYIYIHTYFDWKVEHCNQNSNTIVICTDASELLSWGCVHFCCIRKQKLWNRRNSIICFSGLVVAMIIGEHFHGVVLQNQVSLGIEINTVLVLSICITWFDRYYFIQCNAECLSFGALFPCLYLSWIQILAFLHFPNDMMYKAPVADLGQSWRNIV